MRECHITVHDLFFLVLVSPFPICRSRPLSVKIAVGVETPVGGLLCNKEEKRTAPLGPFLSCKFSARLRSDAKKEGTHPVG